MGNEPPHEHLEWKKDIVDEAAAESVAGFKRFGVSRKDKGGREARTLDGSLQAT